MALLIAGLILFLGIHLVPSAPQLRDVVVTKLGYNRYRGLFSLVSLLGFVLIVYGKGHAPYVHGYLPPVWGRHLAMLLMLISCIFLAAMYLPTNLKRMTAHPMLWGVTFWGAAHLFANGDVASISLFGAFLVFSLFDMVSANRRGAAPKGGSVPIWRDAVVGVVAIVLYAALIMLHPYFAGVSVVRMG